MGKKVHPVCMRAGVIKKWNSNWYAPKSSCADMVSLDYRIREHIYGKLQYAGISAVHISRDVSKTTVSIHTAKPGVIIGKKGNDIDLLKVDLKKIEQKEVSINIQDIRNPDIDAELIAQGIAKQLESCVDYRRAMRRAIQNAKRSGTDGIKVYCAGRLNGHDIARTVYYKEGRISLQTIRSDISYSFAKAVTIYGVCGIKVWICKGDILEKKDNSRYKDIKKKESIFKEG